MNQLEFSNLFSAIAVVALVMFFMAQVVLTSSMIVLVLYTIRAGITGGRDK